ncbi:pilus assembly protein [Breoghania sp.]|uniref:pilus assembly protein n=1 Tax=Breoghania sp. TaxID=2065378 RepID=UPI002AA6AC00|nr:pilus assembly protein [Breoghania sp.]
MRSGYSAAFKALLTRFAHDTSGAIALVWALASIVVVGMVGAAIDYSRTVNVKEEMAMELDGAVLAGARFLASSTDIDASKQHIVDTFTQTAALAIGDAADLKISPADVTINETEGKITATVKGQVQTAFMKVLGIETMNVSVTSQANYADKYLEIALVVDLTGSMKDPDGSGSTRIASLKTAAKALIDVLIPDETSDRVRISIIPYSQGVRLSSSDASAVTDGYSQRCVTERVGSERYTDAPYTSEFIGGGSGYMLGRTLYYMGYRLPDLIYDPEDVPEFYDRYGDGLGACPTEEVMPLTQNRKTLLDKIDAMSANGGTAGQTGIAWGWYTLSPNWNNLWPTDNEAVPYSNEETLKYMILMTDGEFNDVYKTIDITEKDCPGYYRRGCTSTTTKTWWYEHYNQTTDSSNRAKSLCTAMKASPANQGKGIAIYSVYFNPTSNAMAEATMRDCASSSRKFTYASNGQALTETFVKYAKEIQQLYLSR